MSAVEGSLQGAQGQRRSRAAESSRHICNYPSCQCLGSDGPPNPGSSSPARAPISIPVPSPSSSAPPGVRPLLPPLIVLAPSGHSHAVLSSAAEVFPQAPA